MPRFTQNRSSKNFVLIFLRYQHTFHSSAKTISILLIRNICATLIFTDCLTCLWLARISLSTKKNITLYYLRRIIQLYFLSCGYHGDTYDYGHSAMPKVCIQSKPSELWVVKPQEQSGKQQNVLWWRNCGVGLGAFTKESIYIGAVNAKV